MAGTSLLGVNFESDTRLYALAWHASHTPAALTSVVVEGFVSHEKLQHYSQHEILVLSTSANLPIAQALYQPVSLETRLSDGRLHRVSGLIHQAELLGSEGGFARYRFSMVSWVWMLTQQQHSHVWQDQTVMAIIDQVFAQYPFAQWQWSPEVESFMADTRPRSYCVQYRESDYAFVQRLLNEEGLGFRIEEIPDSQPPSHRVILFSDTTLDAIVPEDPTSASPLGGAGIRYHGGRSSEEQDSIQQLGATRRLNPAICTVLSYDYKQKKAVSASARTTHTFGGPNVPWLEHYDTAGMYRHASVKEAERYAHVQLQAFEARNKTWHAKSTVRTLRPGTRFTLTQAPVEPSNYAGDVHAPKMVVLSVYAIGINNLPKEHQETIDTLLGQNEPWLEAAFAELSGPQKSRPTDDRLYRMNPSLRPPTMDPHLLKRLHPDLALAKRLGYANSVDMIRHDIPWRPLPVDERGVHQTPKPTVPGSQTASVIGPTGHAQTAQTNGQDEIYCDHLGRVRIRFHWQGQRHAGLGDDGGATCWVRVAQRSAGAGMGMQFLPRIGQEVHVQFLENDINRPIILGSHYNGQGEGGVTPTPGGETVTPAPTTFDQALDHRVSAQGNTTAGHSPVWHGASPDNDGHRNAAAITGVRSKEFGGTGYNQLLFDDTPQQGRTQLKSTQAGSELNLGHLIHQADNYRGSFRGQGAELRTDAYGALRAGSGYLISSYRYRVNPQQRDYSQDNVAGIAHLKNALQLAKAFNQAATIHQTVRYSVYMGTQQTQSSHLADKDSAKPQAPLAAMVTAASGMVHGQDLSQAQHDAQAKHTRVTRHRVPHSTDPLLHIVGQAGVMMTAQDHVQMASLEHLHISAGGDQQWVTGHSASLHSGQAIGLLAGAVQAGAGDVGLQLKAAQDNIQFETHQDEITLAADGLIDIMSSHAHIDWAAAKKIVLCVEGGASITLENGSIKLTCPGQLTIHAKKKEFLSGGRVTYRLPVMPKKPIESKQPIRFDMRLQDSSGLIGEAYPNADWRIVKATSLKEALSSEHVVLSGKSNDDGYIKLDATQEASLQKTYNLMPNRLWVISNSHARQLVLAKKQDDWSNQEQFYHGLNALGYADDSETSNEQHVEDLFASVARKDLENVSGNSLLKKIKKG